jgi:hypothetical protein
MLGSVLRNKIAQTFFKDGSEIRTSLRQDRSLSQPPPKGFMTQAGAAGAGAAVRFLFFALRTFSVPLEKQPQLY